MKIAWQQTRANLLEPSQKVRLMHRSRFICFCFLVFLPSFINAAENIELTQQELDSVNFAISEIQDWLTDASTRQSAAETQLQEAETEVARISQSIAELELVIANRQSELVDLQEQQTGLTNRLEVDQELLSQAIRIAYLANDQSFLKTLLNQEDIAESARLLHYSRVFSDSQLNNINSYRNALSELDRVNESLTVTLNELNAQQRALQNEAAALSEAKQDRAIALVNLNNDIATRSSELETLESSQQELEALLAEIRRAMEGVTSFADVPPFADERGSLPPPLAGPVTTQFGSRYGDGNLERRGITIAAAAGTPVKAIHAGRIVFSDWLRGSGLLVIIDHGNGYMSLYGANQALTQAAGNWVDAGETIASSGAGSARGPAGLYFEIRYRGEAQNPQNWLR